MTITVPTLVLRNGLLEVRLLIHMKKVAKSVKSAVHPASKSSSKVQPVSVKGMTVKPVFFANSTLLREWLLLNHETEKELWVGMYKKHTGKSTVTIGEVIDQCLCFGWIDSIGKSIDEESYTNRITPRNPKKSSWSNINIAKFKVLSDAGQVTQAGREAYERWASTNK